MLAFVDESIKGTLVSIGFYVSKSYIVAFEALMREYKSILKRFSMNFPNEIKFSTILNIIGKALGILSDTELIKVFREAIRVMSLYGYGLAVIMNKDAPSLPKVTEDIVYIKNSITKIRKHMNLPDITHQKTC